jgi:hypothetical protein
MAFCPALKKTKKLHARQPHLSTPHLRSWADDNFLRLPIKAPVSSMAILFHDLAAESDHRHPR